MAPPYPLADQVIERDRLAAALRYVAARQPDKDHARRVAESVIAGHVLDNRERNSGWSGDRQEHLTKGQALRAVRQFACDLTPVCEHIAGSPAGAHKPGCPDCDATAGTWARVHIAVVTAYESGPAATVPVQDAGEGTSYRLRCASCGEPFTPKTKTQRVCSAACRQATYRARKRQRQA